MLFSEALSGYWLDKKLEFAKQTIRNYGYTLKSFEDFIENKSVESITHLDVKAYLVHLSEVDLEQSRSYSPFDNL